MTDSGNFTEYHRFSKGQCDGNVCINRTELIEIIYLDRLCYIELCGECRRLASISQQIRILTDNTELNHFPNPFNKWEDITQLQFDHAVVLSLLKAVLKRLNEFHDLISSAWYGLNALETGIENIVFNIHLVENSIKV